MDLPIVALSILLFAVFVQNLLLRRKLDKVRAENEEIFLENIQNKLSLKKLSIQKDIDSTPLDQLVNGNGDGKDS